MPVSVAWLPTLRADGPMQMALDEVLLQRAEQGLAAFRIYFWDRPTLSLGYFQLSAERLSFPELKDLPIVRRLTGGGAIVHGQDLSLPSGERFTDWTYALVLPRTLASAKSPCCWHDEIHNALVSVLQRWGVSVQLVPRPRVCASATAQSAAKASQKAGGHKPSSSEFLCFARPAPGDIVWQDRKVVGSAQRLRHGALLQHGSMTLPSWPCAAEQLAQAWLEALGWLAEPTEWNTRDINEAERLANEKYRQPSWNYRR